MEQETTALPSQSNHIETQVATPEQLTDEDLQKLAFERTQINVHTALISSTHTRIGETLEIPTETQPTAIITDESGGNPEEILII